ncbi:hypothetical protein L7F22_045535 [Adiantum nelumboides]|nr:hypothetical protein [Adiantum nelumboides]
MSAGLFSTHHQTHDFKRTPSLPQLLVAAGADHCSNGASPKPGAGPPFISSASPSGYNACSTASDSNFHTLDLRYKSAFPIDAASIGQVSASKFPSFNGELNLQTVPHAAALDPSGQYQHALCASTHMTSAAASSTSSGGPQICNNYVAVGSSTADFNANFSQKPDLEVRNTNITANPQATGKQQLSGCDYAERIQELRAALLRRNGSKPAVYVQNDAHRFVLQAGCNWREQQQYLEENARCEQADSDGSFVPRKGVQDIIQEDDQYSNYLGRLRVAAASVGSLTNQSPQRPNFGSSTLSESSSSNKLTASAASFSSQTPALQSATFEKTPSRDRRDVHEQEVIKCSRAGSNTCSGLKETMVIDVNKDASSVGAFPHSHLQIGSVSSCIDQASTMGDFRRTCKGAVSGQDNATSSDPSKTVEFAEAQEPAVIITLGPYKQAPSLGGFLHPQRPSPASELVAGPNHEKQASAFLSKEDASNSSKLGEVQAAAHERLRDTSNGNLTEFESVQARAPAAAMACSTPPDPLHAEATYMADLQASIMGQGGSTLQRFLPSNDEEEANLFADEELLLEGALFGTDEFRMYEFKVRLCMRERSHDWTQCPFAHPGEKARRRDPRVHHYSAVPCPDFRKAACKRGDACELSHGVFECWLHPTRYRTQICKDGKLCKRKVCFFAHSPSQFRALSSNGASTQKQDSSISMQPAQWAQNMPISQSFDGSSLRLLQHIPARLYYQALLKQDLTASQIPDPHLNPATIMPSLNSHPLCQHQYYSNMEATASLPFNASPLRLAMAYGLPINADGATLSNVNSSCQSVSSPRSLNLPSYTNPLNGRSSLPQDQAASASGFLCCKGPPPASNYVNVDDVISMHNHKVYGGTNFLVPEGQTDNLHMRALQAASLDDAKRQMILNGEAVGNEFVPVSKLNAVSNMHNSSHQTGLPSSNIRPLIFSSNASPNWNVLSSPPLPRFMPGPSLDAVSQAQAVLTAHALAQRHGPSSTIMSPYARHQVDFLNNGTQGPTIPVIPNLKNVDYIDDQHKLQNAGKGLDSPQAVSQLLASIQQLELRCATAEMKNNLMMAQAAQVQQSGCANNSPSTANSNSHHLETWDGLRPESGAGSCHRIDVAGAGSSLKGAAVCGPTVWQGTACVANVPDHKASFDVGWVDELL